MRVEDVTRYSQMNCLHPGSSVHKITYLADYGQTTEAPLLFDRDIWDCTASRLIWWMDNIIKDLGCPHPPLDVGICPWLQKTVHKYLALLPCTILLDYWKITAKYPINTAELNLLLTAAL